MSRRLDWRRPALVAIALLAAAGAQASSMGITGFSGLQGDTCRRCHSGGMEPVARFEGPATVVAGSLPTFRFAIDSTSPQQTVAGFDVAATSGELEPGAGARKEFGEITQTEPQAALAGRAVWSFRWRVPSEPGEHGLYGSGLSANGNGGRGGDESVSIAHIVTVVPDPLRGDANCDDRISASDLITIARLVVGTGADVCGRADSDCDGSLGAGDLDATVTAVFNPPAPEPCAN